MKKILCMAVMLVSLMTGTAFAREAHRLPGGGYMPRVTKIEMDKPSDIPEGVLFSAADDLPGNGSFAVEDYYGYQTVNRENSVYGQVYKYLLREMTAGTDEIVIADYGLTIDEVDKLFYACLNDNPRLIHVNTGYSFRQYIGSDNVYSILPLYFYTWRNPTALSQFEAAADEMIKKSGAKPEMSDYDKAIMLHDELAANIVYDNDVLALYNDAYNLTDKAQQEAELERIDTLYGCVHTAYGALVNGRAVCDGYSRAYQYLLYKMGIMSHIATGVTPTGGHGWNAVKLDGDWYYSDLTWDDSGDVPVFYAYYNMTDAQLADCQHVLDNPYAMPACSSTRLNYFTINGGKNAYSPNVDHISQQIKTGAYARAYITGDSIADIEDWINNNAMSIILKSQVNATGLGYWSSGREWIIYVYHDSVSPGRNTAVEICTNENRTAHVYAGFYDASGRLLWVEEKKNVELTAGSIRYVNFDSSPDGYKTVKYFVWYPAEGGNIHGMKPILNSGTEEY